MVGFASLHCPALLHQITLETLASLSWGWGSFATSTSTSQIFLQQLQDSTEAATPPITLVGAELLSWAHSRQQA